VPPSPASRGAAVPLLGGTLALLYLAGRLLPGLGHDVHLAVRWWGGFALYGAGAALCLARARRVPADRLVWSLLGAGVAAYGLASVAAHLSSRALDDPPLVSYAGWLAFYAAAYPALVVLLRDRIRPFTLSFCLDGVLGGLTMATLCAALVVTDLQDVAPLKAVAGLTFPCADLVLASILLWACAMTGWRAAQLWWLIAAMATAAVGDVVQDAAILHGHFGPLDWTTAAFPLAMLMVGVAAWSPAAAPRPLRTEALAVLALPLGCLVAVMGVLALGDGDDPLPCLLGFSALLVAVVRSGLTFREVSDLHGARRFARGFEEAAIGMAFVSLQDLTYTRVNEAHAAILQRPVEEIVGTPMSAFNAPGEEGAARDLRLDLLAGEAPAPYVRRILRPDGTIADLAISAAVVDDEHGVAQLFAQIQDVTEPRRTARHNGALVELSRLALELREPDELLDGACDVIRACLRAEAVEVRGPSAGDEEGRSPRVVRAPLRPRHGLPAALVARRASAHPPFLPAHARFLEAAANVLGTALDRAAVEEELRTQALEDPLTGLANRSYLAAHVEQAIAGAGRGEQLALLLLDLDRFKVVNDTLGHGAGDELLCAVADRLRSTIRRGDLAARLGGDEFVVVCTGAGGAPHEVASLSSRLLDAVAAPYVVDGRELHISASAGLVFVDGPDATAESLLRDADVAMYRAKEHGGARYEVFDAGLRAAVVHRLTVEGELRHVLEREELALRVQPIVDLHRDEVAGFEALVRWQHPERGLVGPAEFVPIAEETGLIVPIGGWVLAEALRWLRTLQDVARRPLRMSVNLSARQLAPELIGEVRAALAGAGVEPRQLTLEVTETLIVDGPGAVGVLDAMRAMGVAIAIDDFGTGWSSLGALQRYPVDVLKLDRSLVAPAAASASAAALARAVVEMAQALGLDVIAEGIEDDEQLAAMRALGCPHGQGYAFARPMALEDALTLVAPTARAAGAPAA
jgi:diguanylate cyclase (GGDEF)-like protein